MPEWLAAIDAGQVGVSGLALILLGLVVRALIKGDLVPRQTVEDALNVRDEQIVHYRDAFERERDGHLETRRQVTTLAQSGGTAAQALDAMQKRAGGD